MSTVLNVVAFGKELLANPQTASALHEHPNSFPAGSHVGPRELTTVIVSYSHCAW